MTTLPQLLAARARHHGLTMVSVLAPHDASRCPACRWPFGARTLAFHAADLGTHVCGSMCAATLRAARTDATP